MKRVPDQMPKEAHDAAIKWAMGVLEQMPKATALEREAHITAVLVVFWGALWGTFGTEYADGFIKSQLNGMRKAMAAEGGTPRH